MVSSWGASAEMRGNSRAFHIQDVRSVDSMHDRWIWMVQGIRLSAELVVF